MIPQNNDIRIEVTTHCNYNCVICPRETLTRPLQTMSTGLFCELLDKILSETDQYDTVTFPGMGEPFLDPELPEKVHFVKSKGLKALLLTNGSLLSVDKFRELEEIGADSIRVSLYGHTSESYCQVHGISNNHKYSQLKDNLVEICKLKKTCQLLLTYNIVEGTNDQELEDWISFWKDRVDLLEVWKPHNWVDAKEFRKVQPKLIKTCGRPFNGPLQVQVDGTVNMCCFDYNGKLLLGDLKTQSLHDIFEGTEFKELEKRHKSGDYTGSNLICEYCDQRNEEKTGILVYNSKYNIEERVHQTSSTYQKVDCGK